VPFRTCRADQEEEATTLGGTLLLPRKMLLGAASRGMSAEDVASHYGVTLGVVLRAAIESLKVMGRLFFPVTLPRLVVSTGAPGSYRADVWLSLSPGA